MLRECNWAEIWMVCTLLVVWGWYGFILALIDNSSELSHSYVRRGSVLVTTFCFRGFPFRFGS